MTRKVILNPYTVWLITTAGSRERAVEKLEGMLREVSPRMADAIRDRTAFHGKPHEESYFRYLCKVRHLISQTYPKRVRKRA